MNRIFRFFSLSSLFIVLLILGCAYLKTSRPILPIKEYERMVAGRFDADYVGTDRCLSACHAHDKIRSYFEASTMGVQLSRESGLPLVNCESCHGPGSLAVKDITKERVKADEEKGIRTACDYKTFIDIENLPAPAKSLICLKCHTGNATFNLHNWNAGIHAINDVSCIDCHTICKTFKAGSPDLKVRPRDTAEMCYKCHTHVRAEFMLPSHHPVNEKKVFCTSCHDPHDGGSEKPFRRLTIKDTCTYCHVEKAGPFVFEHGGMTDDCMGCHSSHGSPNNNLLNVRMPFLCLQCHDGHVVRINGTRTTGESKRVYYTRCTDCHPTIHGTDIPSASGKGYFTQ